MKIKKYDYIFLDLDGTILDGKNRHYHCYTDIVNKYGGVLLDINCYWEMSRHRVDKRKLLELSEFRGTYQQYREEWIQRIEQKEYLEYDILLPETITTIKNLRECAQHLYLVTLRNHRENLMWQLQRLHILNLFERVISGIPGEKRTKYDLVKEIPMENALFIGDTEIDLETAKLCGGEFKGVLNGIRSREAFPEAQVYENLSELYLSL